MKRGILADHEELSALRNRISNAPYEAIYSRLKNRCALILETPPVTEAQWRMMWQKGVWGSALLSARTSQGRMIDLLVAHQIEPNTAYRDRAVEELKNLISWTTWTDPCHNGVPADLCTSEAAVAAVLALDWLWEDLSEEDRRKTMDAIWEKALLPYRLSVEKQVDWYNGYYNWNAVINSGCGLAAMVLTEEFPQAEETWQWAMKGLEKFFDAFGREGGWDEGTGYWGYAMRYLLLLAEASSRLMDDQGIYHRRGMDVTGLFPVYFCPHGTAASFGDAPYAPIHGTYYLLSKYFDVAPLTRWLDTYTFQHDVTTSGWSEAGMALLCRPESAKTNGKSKLDPLKTYPEIGWAAMADGWPEPGMYVAAKAGDLGANHSQHDMNSLQLQVEGEMLLVDLGAADYNARYFSEDRGEFYEAQAQAHNTIVTAEQDHLIDAQGQIADSREGGHYRWITLNAGEALGDDVQFIRHVVMVVDPKKQVGETLVVFDELTHGSPEKMELFWHAGGEVEQFDPVGKTGIIRGNKAAIRFALASTVNTSLELETVKYNGTKEDRRLSLRGGVLGRAYFASVFSRYSPPHPLDIKKTETGMTVSYGDLTLHFKSGVRHLTLKDVRR